MLRRRISIERIRRRARARNLSQDTIEPQANEQAVAKAIASMQAFDAMPQEWRAFCADYGRTARGESLAMLLVESGGDVDHAKWQMSVLLPMATQAEHAQAKPKRKRKAKT